MATCLPRDVEQLLYISLGGGRYAGYKTEFMVERFDNEMCCVFCFGISQMPTRITTCGHVACKPCLESTVALGVLKCPSDSRSFTAQQVQGDANMAKRIGEMEVSCPLQVKGCSWAGKLKHCYLHLQSGCEAPAPDPADYIRCQHCNEEILIGREEEEHTEKCPAILVSCPNQCQVELISRSHLPTHLQDCPSSVVACPLQQLGCGAHCPRSELHFHMVSEMVQHMTLLAASVAQKRIDDLGIHNVNIGDFNERINRLEETVATRDNEIALLKSQCKILSDKIIERENPVMQASTRPAGPEYTYSPFCWVVHELQSKRAGSCEVFSPGVYSAPGGYCLLFKLVAGGLGMGRDTHLSLIAHLCKGSFDSNLIWPVKFKLRFTVLNQATDRQHIQLERMFTFSEQVSPPNVISLESLILPDFLLYKHLITTSRDIQYIREDSISIQIRIEHVL